MVQYQEWSKPNTTDNFYDKWRDVRKPKRPSPKAKEEEQIDDIISVGKKAGSLAAYPSQKILFDYMQRGNFAVAGGAEKYLEGKYSEIPYAMWKGATGQETKTFTEDIIPKYRPSRVPPRGEDDDQYRHFEDVVSGLALDIATDPLSYTPAGMFTAPLKFAGKTKLGQKTLKALNKSKAGEMWNTLFRPRGGSEEFKKYYDLKLYTKYGQQAAEHDILQTLKQITKGLSNHDLEFMSRTRRRLIENPNALELLPDGHRVRYEMLAKHLDDSGQALVDSGHMPKEDFLKTRDHYLPGYYPGKTSLIGTNLPASRVDRNKKAFFMKKKTYASPIEAEAAGHSPELNLAFLVGLRDQQALAFRTKEKFTKDVLEQFGTPWKVGDEIPEGSKVFFPKGRIRFYPLKYIDSGFEKELMDNADQLKKFWDETKRTTKTTTKQTIKREGAEAAGPTGPMEKLVTITKDSLKARGFTEGEAASAIERLRSGGSGEVKEIFEEITKEIEDISYVKGQAQEFAGELIPFDKIKEGIGVSKKVPAYILPDEISADMNRASKFFDRTAKAESRLARWHDKALNTWKGMATSLRLPFHVRNMETNWFMMYLGGAENFPKRVEQAAKVQMGKGNVTIAGKTWKASELKALAREYGVAGRGWMGADVPDFFLHQLAEATKDGSKLKKLWKNSNPVKWGRTAGTAVEDNARIGLFLDALDKGEDYFAASTRVRKYLYDYSELTDFEKSVMKRIFPFYTWTRKTAPLMLEQMAEQPAKFANIGKGHRALSEAFPETDEEKMYRPDYYNELFYQKIGNEKGKDGKPIYMHADLPYMEFSRLVKAQNIVSMIQPVPFKLLFEELLNFKTFPKLGIPIDRLQKMGSETMKELDPAPFYTLMMPKKIQDMLGLQPMRNPDTGEMDIVGMPAKKRYALSIMLPMFEEWDKAYPQPLRVAEEKAPWRKLSYFTGIRFDVNDPKTQAKYRALEKRGKIEILQKYIMMTGQPPTDKMIDEILGKK